MRVRSASVTVWPPASSAVPAVGLQAANMAIAATAGTTRVSFMEILSSPVRTHAPDLHGQACVRSRKAVAQARYSRACFTVDPG